MEGFIKLYRKLLDNPIICKDGDHLAVWIYLLLNATHKEYPSLFKGKKIILNPGQLLTGRKSISENINISESKVQRILKTFENEQQIEQQTSNKNRLVTIVKWKDYQASEQQIEQLVNNKRTTTEQQLNTNKNVKNVKNIYIDHFDAFWNAYPRKVAKATAQKSFIKLKVDEALLNKMLSAIETQKQSRQWQTKEYIPHPSTWLNQKRWEDEVEEIKTGMVQQEDGSFKLE